jgi:hypothetical protein
MPDNNRPYEPLTSENAALVLVDHQVGLMSGVRDYSIGSFTRHPNYRPFHGQRL